MADKEHIRKIFSKNKMSSFGINSLFGSWGKGESGSKFLKRVRYGKEEKAREKYLAKLWKKSV